MQSHPMGGRSVRTRLNERVALGGPGRPPTTLARVDDILDNSTAIRYDPIRDRDSWNVINRTGDDFFEQLLTGQLSRNGLGSGGYTFPGQ